MNKRPGLLAFRRPVHAANMLTEKSRPSNISVDTLPEKVVIDEDEVCAICFEQKRKGLKYPVLPCEHSFHEDCLNPWLRVASTCPMCRKDVEAEDIEAEDVEAAAC